MAEAKNLGKQLGYTRNEINEVVTEMQGGDYDKLCDVFENYFGHVVQLTSGQKDENFNNHEDYGDWVDGDALASVGSGTDEDYGYYGERY